MLTLHQLSEIDVLKAELAGFKAERLEEDRKNRIEMDRITGEQHRAAAAAAEAKEALAVAKATKPSRVIDTQITVSLNLSLSDLLK